MTVHLGWTGAVRGTVQTLFTDPITAPINRPTGDHRRGHNVCNDTMTVHLGWTGAVRGTVQTLFTDPITDPNVLNPHALENFALRPLCLLFVLFRTFL
jgi:hypothetical protein